MHSKTIMHHRKPLSKQRGSALIVGLIIVLMMTLLGITTLRTTALQERMAGNERDINVALQSAEAGLREVGQKDLRDELEKGSAGFGSLITAFTDSGSAAVSEFTYWTSVFDWASDGVAATATNGASETPKYYVENTTVYPNGIPTPGKATRLFKITVRGKGASSRAEVIVQGTRIVE
jgi:type IV pilus assembly protein PilX